MTDMVRETVDRPGDHEKQQGQRRSVSVRVSITDDDMVPPDIVSTIFYSASVSDSLAILVAEKVAAGRCWATTPDRVRGDGVRR